MKKEQRIEKYHSENIKCFRCRHRSVELEGGMRWEHRWRREGKVEMCKSHDRYTSILIIKLLLNGVLQPIHLYLHTFPPLIHSVLPLGHMQVHWFKPPKCILCEELGLSWCIEILSQKSHMSADLGCNTSLDSYMVIPPCT